MLTCFWCKRPGKATDKHFPVQVFQKRRSFKKEDGGEIKITDPVPALVGHLCRVCVKKEIKKGNRMKQDKARGLIHSISNYR